MKELRNLGIKSHDEKAMLDFLQFVDINRISDYCPIVKGTKVSNAIWFEDLRETYAFDTELKQLLWKWIEPIEVKARAQFVNAILEYGGVLEYRNVNLFKNADDHAKALNVIDKEIRRAKENNVQVVVNNLDEHGNLPVFSMVEICSFGTLSKLCGNLQRNCLGLISRSFGLTNYYFTTWLRHLVTVRNICAHHNRFYGRPMIMSPKLLKVDSQYSSRRQFPTFIVLKRIYENIDDFELIRFLVELNDIVEKYRHVSLTPMGFPDKWQDVLRD